MNSKSVFFIDPQSLIPYDTGLLSAMEDRSGILLLAGEGFNLDIDTKPVFNHFKYKNKVIKGLCYLYSIIKIVMLIIKHSPKVVHIEWIRFFPIDYLFLKFIKKRGIKVVYTGHNILPHDDINEQQYDNYKKYYHAVDKIIVHTNRTKEELIERFEIIEDKIVVIPHGLNKVKINEQEVENYQKFFTEKFDLKGKTVFTSLGSQGHYKGFEILKETWIETSELANNDKVVLLIAGNMSFVDSSKLDECKNVHIVDGVLSNDEFIALARIGSVAILPYISISQSGVLMTAMQEHIPVLVTDVGGLPDPINLAKVGWNMGQPTTDNLREWMLYLANNNEEIETVRFDKLAWSVIDKEFSWRNSATKTTDIYNSLMNK